MIKIFSFPKIKMQFEPIFLQVLWEFLSARRSREAMLSSGQKILKVSYGGLFLK